MSGLPKPCWDQQVNDGRAAGACPLGRESAGGNRSGSSRWLAQLLHGAKREVACGSSLNGHAVAGRDGRCGGLPAGVVAGPTGQRQRPNLRRPGEDGGPLSTAASLADVPPVVAGEPVGVKAFPPRPPGVGPVFAVPTAMAGSRTGLGWREAGPRRDRRVCGKSNWAKATPVRRVSEGCVYCPGLRHSRRSPDTMRCLSLDTGSAGLDESLPGRTDTQSRAFAYGTGDREATSSFRLGLAAMWLPGMPHAESAAG